MARRFAKFQKKKLKKRFFYPSDFVNTKTNIPLRVGEERGTYTSTLRVSVYIHHYSPPLRGIVVYYSNEGCYPKSLTTGYFCAENKKKLNVDADILNNNLLKYTTHLLEDFIFLASSSFLQLSSATFFSFTDSSLALSQHGKSVNASLLLQFGDL